MLQTKSNAWKLTSAVAALLLFAASADAQERPTRAHYPSRDIEAAGPAPRDEGPADVVTAAERLNRSALGLLDSLKHNPALSGAERQNLSFRAKHLTENAQSVVDLADVGPAAADRLERAVARVDEYSDQLDELVASVENVRFLRRPHEAFLAALDGMHLSLKAAAEARAHAKPRPRPRGKAKGKAAKGR
jgi:hypothetical protein